MGHTLGPKFELDAEFFALQDGSAWRDWPVVSEWLLSSRTLGSAPTSALTYRASSFGTQPHLSLISTQQVCGEAEADTPWSGSC